VPAPGWRAPHDHGDPPDDEYRIDQQDDLDFLASFGVTP
jgi:hypothetical protein